MTDFMKQAHNDMQSFPNPAGAQAAAKAEKREKEEEKARKAEEAAAKRKAKAAEPKAQAASKPKIASAPPESRAKEMKLMKIRLYVEKLGHKLHDVYIPKTLPKDEDDIDSLLASIEISLQSSGGIAMAETGFVNVCGLAEMANAYMGSPMLLSGPALSLSGAAAQSQDAWKDLVTEFAIGYAEWFIVGPGKRLIAFTYGLASQVHAMNVAAMRGGGPPKEKEEAAEN